MAKKLLIVESNKKAKSISKFLGSDWIVKPCFGHVCDLPLKEYGVDKESWDEKYEVNGDFSKRVVSELKAVARQASVVYLGTDPDREGEAIAWHLARILSLKKGQYKRVEWNAITKSAVEAAIHKARDIDDDWVNAQRTRRVIDRVIGWEVSPRVCWPAGFRSAGRVQNPALHILCSLEREIQAFVAEDYWNLGVTYAEGLEAIIPEEVVEVVVNDEGEQKERRRIRAHRFPSESEARKVESEAKQHPHVVQSVDKVRSTRSPFSAYDTAELQKDASAKLGLSPKKTMEIAQELYELGFITYMRTDSTRLAPEFVEKARAHIATEHGPEILSESANTGRAGAQDAHEAIRPTELGELGQALPKGSEKLYAMIVARALATQCKPAVFDNTSVHIASGAVRWLAKGSVLAERGYLVYWGPYGRDKDTLLPEIREGQTLNPSEFSIDKMRTSPPARYSEADLIAKMKASKIGRPSTYAPTIETLISHGYAAVDDKSRKKALVPTRDGMLMDGLMSCALPPLVAVEYTAEMEETLDRIEKGGLDRTAYLRQWWAGFDRALVNAESPASAYRAEHGLKANAKAGSAAEPTDTKCDACGQSNYIKLAAKKGKSKFLKCEACGFIRDVKAQTRPCPRENCGGTLVERQRKDKSGSFMACVKKGCPHIENTDGSSGGGGTYLRPEDTDKPCPRCEKTKLQLWRLRQPTVGKGDFYSCPDKGCKFTLNFGARRHKVNCEKCGGMMLERIWDQNRFWGCAKCSHTRPSGEAAAT